MPVNATGGNGKGADEKGDRGEDPADEGDPELDERFLTEAEIARFLRPASPGAPAGTVSAAAPSRIRPGQTVEPVMAPLDLVHRLLVRSLSVAAGAGRNNPVLWARPLLWDTGTDQLLLHLAKASMTTGSGFVDLQLPVQCDQTGQAEVVMTYLTASPERPHGFVVASEDRPRGPEVVVQVWGEALVALGWRALVEMAALIAATRGRSTSGLPLVASTVVATPDGLTITAMGPHRFGTGVGSTR
ncbi:MAG: hypothetical protein M3314_13030 [Actinomycetota bacterium]|nr:hypothetical protein [Actinomycetota bacterium]